MPSSKGGAGRIKPVLTTLFDLMAVAYTIDPNLCPTTPLHIDVDSKGFTRETQGSPNAQVCLSSQSDDLLRFFIPRIVN